VHLDTVLTARPGSAGWQPAVSPIGKRQRSAPTRPLPLASSTPCGLKIRDTADCKSALLQEPWPEAPVSLQTRRFSHCYHPNPTLSPCAWTKSIRAWTLSTSADGVSARAWIVSRRADGVSPCAFGPSQRGGGGVSGGKTGLSPRRRACPA
jgi:hypothetical protein